LGLDISPPTKQVGPDHYWPEGYRRTRDGFTLVMETGVVALGLGLGLKLLGIPGSQGAGVLVLLAMLILLAWFEWATRCEDRGLVAKVSAAILAAEAATLAYQHERREHEREQRQQQDAYRDAASWALNQQRTQDSQDSNQPTPLQVSQNRDQGGSHLNQFGYLDGSL